MATIHVNNGSLLVEFPEAELERELSVFNHETREYEYLFTRSPGRDALVTMPGFAERAKSCCENSRILDERRPLPDPEEMSEDVLEVWRKPIGAAIKSGGGIVQIPSVLGMARLVAEILRAYPKQNLVDRGTPISIIAVRDNESAKVLKEELSNLLPGREIGRADSDDIIVTPYSSLDDVPRHLTGIFIGDLSGDVDPRKIVEGVSGFRSAARWGVYETDTGGKPEVDLVTEGLFGQVVASASYADAVKAGLTIPITVCWLEVPQPPRQVLNEFKFQEANATAENPGFIRMVSDIVRKVPGDVGCCVVADTVAAVKRLQDANPALVTLETSMTKKERLRRTEDIESGVVRKFATTSDVCPSIKGVGVVISASCRKTGQKLPWREKKRDGERAYVVDFLHKWDLHNGRPGHLGLGDKARERSYSEAGFSQLRVANVQKLPF